MTKQRSQYTRATFYLLLATLLLFLHTFSYANAATDTLFSDGFESGDFSAWHLGMAGSDWSTVENPAGAHTGDYRAKAVGDDTTGSVLAAYVDATAYNNVTLSFWYRIPTSSGFEAGEGLDVNYNVLGGSNWVNLVRFEDGDETDEWTYWEGVLPAGAIDNDNVGIHFKTDAANASDVFELDDVTVTADPIYQPTGEIISPADNDYVYGEIDLLAEYDDGDNENDDIVQWAVREGTCAASTNTVYGNVDTYNDSYTWDGTHFSATIDTKDLAPGLYCFIFNPKDDIGQNDVRETRLFYVVDEYVSGGGQILEQIEGKKKDWLKVSFGGWFADMGELVGEWEVNFHKVAKNSGMLNKKKFHSSEIVAYEMYNGTNDSCTAAVNMTMKGSFAGEDGYKVILRAGDSDGPASKDPDDTFRVEMWNASNVKVYDSHWGTEFSDESTCVGTARTGLDAGNVDIIRN